LKASLRTWFWSIVTSRKVAGRLGNVNSPSGKGIECRSSELNMFKEELLDVSIKLCENRKRKEIYKSNSASLNAHLVSVLFRLTSSRRLRSSSIWFESILSLFNSMCSMRLDSIIFGLFFFTNGQLVRASHSPSIQGSTTISRLKYQKVSFYLIYNVTRSNITWNSWA